MIAGWCPRGPSVAAQAFARAVVSAAAPQTPARAKALLFAASGLAAFGERIGLEPSAELLLDPVIERFMLDGRAAVLAGDAADARDEPAFTRPRPRGRPGPGADAVAEGAFKRPDSEAELAGYLALAGARSRTRRMRAGALVCVGAGAGLIGQELRHLRGSDVGERSGGLVVSVGGARARVVPVLGPRAAQGSRRVRPGAATSWAEPPRSAVT